MPERAVLQLPARADDGPLAVALDRRRIAAERVDQRESHLHAQRLQVLHETGDLRLVAPGEGIGDDRQRPRPASAAASGAGPPS